MVEALRRLVAREGGAVAVADGIDVNDQSIYQILKGVRLPSGRPKGVGPTLRAKLDARYPGWLAAVTPARPTTTLDQALPVLLGRLAGLDDYTASKVLGALQAATRSQAPLEAIERDLLQWLGERAASTTPAALPEKRQANG